jgi:hypothetical protein
MTSYLHDLNREYKLQAGNPIGCAFNVHSTQYFSPEKEITVTVQQLDNKWLALIWTDAGHDLGNGPEGPWRPDRSRTSTRKSPFLPTIQHFPNDPSKSLHDFAIPDSHQSRGPFAQSVSLLAKTYRLTLDPCLLAIDSFYTLSKLFQSSANSICQLFNLVESIIDQSTG